MSTTLEKQTDLNPFASPVGPAALNKVSTTHKSEKPRASQKKLARINRLSIVSDLSYVATWCCFFVSLYFLRGEEAEIALIGYWVTLFVFWYSTVAAFFRTSRPEAFATPFGILIPIAGFFFFLVAKQGITEFMISNGYRPRFLGFTADESQRKAMEADPSYTPNLYRHLDGTHRKNVYSLGESWIIMGAIGFAVLTVGFLVAITCFGY